MAKKQKEQRYLLFATRNGKVKKTVFDDYQNIRQNGLTAISLDKTDRLLSVFETSGNDQVLLVTSNGKSILINENEIRDTGRATQGVKGIELKGDDYVVGMEVIREDKLDYAKEHYEVLVITENGHGKKTKFSEYSQQGRGGQGVFTVKLSAKTGKLVAMRMIKPQEMPETEGDDEISQDALESGQTDMLVISQKGQTIRLSIEDVPLLGRHTQGVRIIRLSGDDKASAMELL